MPPSISTHSRSVMAPARLSSQNFQASEPEPRDAALPVAAQHRPCGEVDEGQPRADGAQHEARRGLVAAAHQHRAVDGMGADQLLRLDREQVAVEHRRGLDEVLRQADRRQLDRHPAGLKDPALDPLRPVAEVQVAGVDLRPGVEDRDHGLAGPVLRREPHLHRAGAVAEAPQVVLGEPARAAQRVGVARPSVVPHRCPPLDLPALHARRGAGCQKPLARGAAGRLTPSRGPP